MQTDTRWKPSKGPRSQVLPCMKLKFSRASNRLSVSTRGKGQLCQSLLGTSAVRADPLERAPSCSPAAATSCSVSSHSDGRVPSLGHGRGHFSCSCAIHQAQKISATKPLNQLEHGPLVILPARRDGEATSKGSANSCICLLTTTRPSSLISRLRGYLRLISQLITLHWPTVMLTMMLAMMVVTVTILVMLVMLVMHAGEDGHDTLR